MTFIKRLRFSYYSIILAVVVMIIMWGLGASVVLAQITELKSDIEINEDGSATIIQEFTYDFGVQAAPGFLWRVPNRVQYEGKVFKYDPVILSVARDSGQESYTLERTEAQTVLTLGDETIPLTGEHQYRIMYVLESVVSISDSELDYLVVPVVQSPPVAENVTANLEFIADPREINFTSIECRVVDQFGRSCPVQTETGVDESGAYVAQADEVRDGQVMLLTGELPAGAVIVSNINFMEQYVDYLEFGALIIFGVLLLWGTWLYRRWKRDKHARDLTPRYLPPEGIRPIFTGMFVDSKLHINDLTAGMLSLAQRSSLTLQRIEPETSRGRSDYILKLDKDIGTIENSAERGLAELIFGGKAKRGDSQRLSNLESATYFAESFQTFRNHVKNMLVEQGYIKAFATLRRRLFIFIGSGFLVYSLVFVSMYDLPFVLAILTLAIGFALAYYGVTYSAYTAKGQRIRDQLRGFGLFMVLDQNERRHFTNAPQRAPEQFIEFLPYAVALGIEEQWSHQFEHMYIEAPYWYQGDIEQQSLASLIGDEMEVFNDIVDTWMIYAAEKTRVYVERGQDDAGKEMFWVRGFGASGSGGAGSGS